MKKKVLGDNNLLMQLNKRIGKKRVIGIVCIIVFIFLFLVGNFIINGLFCLLQHDIANVISFKNFYTLQLLFLTEHKNFWIFYIGLFVIDTIYSIILAYHMYTAYTDMNIGQKGTSRWTTVVEIKEQYKEVSDRNIEFEGHGGIPVARIGNKLYIDDTNTNTSVIGITRSGKGELIVVPGIDLYSRGKEKDSIVTIDMKLELICRSYDQLIKRGYDVYFLNLEDPSMGDQFNPLNLIVKSYISGDEDQAQLLCEAFAYSIYNSSSSKSGGDDNADFFLDNASAALSAMILAHIDDCNNQDIRDNAKAEIQFILRQEIFSNMDDATKEIERQKWFDHKPDLFTLEKIQKFSSIPDVVKYEKTHENLKKVTVASVVNTFRDLASDYINSRTTKLDVYFEKRPMGDIPKTLYSSIEVSGDRTKGSICSQMLTKLKIYTYKTIRKLTGNSSFDIENLGFGDRPVAVFIGVPFYDRSKDSIVSTLIGQIFQANARRAAMSKGLKCARRIIFHLDEIGQYPPIKDFQTMISVGLGCNMIFNLFLQSYSMLEAKYGEDAKTIKANLGNQVYIQTSLVDQAKEFEELFGNETITNITRTGKKLQLSKTFTELYEERPLIGKNELMKFRPGENAIMRVMKRTDLKGNKVVPYPILNSIDRGTGYLFSYEYLTDTFPTDKQVSDLNIKKVSDDSVPEFYNYKYTMNKYAYEYMEQILASGNEEEIQSITPQQLAEFEAFKKFYRFDKQVKDVTNGQSYLDFAKKHNIDVKDDCKLGEFIDRLCTSDTSIKEKAIIISLINKGA